MPLRRHNWNSPNYSNATERHSVRFHSKAQGFTMGDPRSNRIQKFGKVGSLPNQPKANAIQDMVINRQPVRHKKRHVKVMPKSILAANENRFFPCNAIAHSGRWSEHLQMKEVPWANKV